MPANSRDHDQCVQDWFGRTAAGRSPEMTVIVLERALVALWRRCECRLGDVTLCAIADRVLHEARERHACLAHLAVTPTGIAFDGLRGRATMTGMIELGAAARFILAEFLRVVGRLTAEVLTPALHAELLALGAPAHGDGDGDSEGEATAGAERAAT